jgi:23S rRNA pseudouridine1911/1915/1917 synthase
LEALGLDGGGGGTVVPMPDPRPMSITPEFDDVSDEEPEAESALAEAPARLTPELIEHCFVVEAECHGWRLDRFLMKKMRRLSRTRIQRVIRGDLDIDGVRVTRPAQAVQAGQAVRFRRPAPAEPEVPREVPVVLTDPHFYVLDKPAGLPIHPTARYHYATLTAVLRERFPGETLHVCHRLDRETSGLLLVARTHDAAVRLKRAFARRQVRKRYLAIVRGQLEGERLVDAPLGLEGGRVRVRMAVREDGLPSRTRVVALGQAGAYTLVSAHPETGRQHQIRTHLAAIGHPIVGDKLYPDEELFMEWADHGMSEPLLARLELPRHALHAAALDFPHPATGERVGVESPLPRDLAAFLEQQR